MVRALPYCKVHSAHKPLGYACVALPTELGLDRKTQQPRLDPDPRVPCESRTPGCLPPIPPASPADRLGPESQQADSSRLAEEWGSGVLLGLYKHPHLLGHLDHSGFF